MISKEAAAIYLAGLIQGIVLVAFPAAGTILTNPQEYNFSSTAYGSLFIPQAVLSITASALNPLLSRKFGSKWVFLLGVISLMIAHPEEEVS
jgi:MFS family permease